MKSDPLLLKIVRCDTLDYNRSKLYGKVDMVPRSESITENWSCGLKAKIG